MSSQPQQLDRSLTLSSATAVNLLDVIGVGPFLTLPLLVATMGGPQAMLGWLFGAGLAICDGLVWAELGAAIPEAGGTYRYLSTIFPGRLGRWLSFLFVFQLCFSAPLSIASGCVGLAQYAGRLIPLLATQTPVHLLHLGTYSVGITHGISTFVAMAALALAAAMQYRNLAHIRGLSFVLLTLVLLTLLWAVATGLLYGHLRQAFTFPHDAFHLDHRFFVGLGSAMLVATYDYWGYYNVTFLGGEVRNPGKTIPHAVLLSIAIVTALYLGLNISVLSVIPSSQLITAADLDSRRAMLSQYMQTAYAPSLGAHVASVLANAAAVLVMVTAFASVFALLLGYSRIPFAAARDGNFISAFGRLHPTRNFPYVSLLALAGVACLCCFLSLGDLIAALVVLRIVLQFAVQHIGVMVLRVRRPDLPRPFRIWLYPLPPVLALLGFAYVVFARPNFTRELLLAALVAIVGSVVFLARCSSRPSTTASETFNT